MPGNGVGDRVHNFFAQENLSRGPRAQDGRWPLTDHLWVGNQKQFGVADSGQRNYNPQQPETERGYGGQRVPDQYTFNITQTNARPEFGRSLSQSHHEQPSSNGYMYGHQSFQTRPDEANFMGVNTEYGQNNSFKSESSKAHGSFDLFGGQHETNSQYPGLLQQPLQQQSGSVDLLRKQQLITHERIQLARQQDSLNQASQFARQQTSGSHLQGVVNGTPTSDAPGYGWMDPAVVNPNWLHRVSSGSHPEPKAEPSLHGVPVSNSRRPINQFPHNSSCSSNSYAAVNTFGQESNSRMKVENTQQINAVQNPSRQESPVEMVQDKSGVEAAPLDPDEEKILFGSDDNIWEAFGSSKKKTGRVSSLLDDSEFASGLPSTQSGSWSALMQSAVAEATTSGDGGNGGGGAGVKEWPDLNFENPEPPPSKHPFEDSGKHHTQTVLTDINMGFQHSSGGNSWLHHGGLPKMDAEESQQYESSVPGQQTPQQHGTSQLNHKRNHWNENEPVAPSMNSGFNMNHANHLNYWKHVDSSVISKGSENSEISQRHPNKKGPQVSEPSSNSSDKEHSNDSYRSSSSNQAGRKIPGPGLGSGKFQYHPMGNLDEDVGMSYGARKGTNTMPVSLQHSQGNFGLTKTSSQGMAPGHLPNIFAPHDRSVDLSTSDKASQPSQNQNMLELLHKVDQSRDGGFARHLNPLERNSSSEVPEPEKSDGSFGGQQRSQSSNSQGIGLQLGPPSERLPIAMQAVKHTSLTQPQLSPFPHFQEASLGEFKNDRMSMSGQSISQTRGNGMMTNQPIAGNESFDEKDVSHSLTGKRLHASHPHASSGMPQQDTFSKTMSNLSSQQLFPASQPLKSQFNIVESTSLGQQNLGEQEAENRGSNSSLSAQGSITSVSEQVTEKVDRGQMMNDSSIASRKDLEAFGRSLKPNNFHQQISLMNQMKAYKHTDNDPNNSVLRRIKDSDNLFHGQQVTIPPTDNVDRSFASVPANIPSKDALATDQNGPTSVKFENSHISPQMAPSWFDHYGTLKTGQMSSQRADAVRTLEQPLKVSDSLEPPASGAADTRQDGVIWKTPAPSSVVVDHQLTSQPLQPSITVQNLVTVRPKKRKLSRHEIHSWLKEVSGSFKNLQGIWTAMMEWCEATKRLIEKVDDDGEIIEDVPRPKRRIILTTQLIQQLFPPPQHSLLLKEATSNYESVAFYAARTALGDACNLVSCVSRRESNLCSDKSREFKEIDDSRLSEAVEDCLSKSKRVESDFLRLDKRASILDLRLEIQDIEKFSVINRFAKYHGRGQADCEASSLSDAAAKTSPKPRPQRYVIAVRFPKNFPERVQCLSL